MVERLLLEKYAKLMQGSAFYYSGVRVSLKGSWVSPSYLGLMRWVNYWDNANLSSDTARGENLLHLAVSPFSRSLLDERDQKKPARYNIKIPRQFAPTGCLWKVLTAPVILNIHVFFSPTSFVSKAQFLQRTSQGTDSDYFSVCKMAR